MQQLYSDYIICASSDHEEWNNKVQYHMMYEIDQFIMLMKKGNAAIKDLQIVKRIAVMFWGYYMLLLKKIRKHTFARHIL